MKRKMNRSIEVVLFDVGGVLVENPKFKIFWGDSDSKSLREQFGERRISTRTFVKRGARLLGITQKEFLQRYKKAYWSGSINPRVAKIYDTIQVRKGLYSDTNPIHMRYLKSKCSALFSKADVSIISKRKSKVRSYKEIIRMLNVQPNSILFIDDNLRYVRLARRSGMVGILFRSSRQLSFALKKARLIS